MALKIDNSKRKRPERRAIMSTQHDKYNIFATNSVPTTHYLEAKSTISLPLYGNRDGIYVLQPVGMSIRNQSIVHFAYKIALWPTIILYCAKRLHRTAKPSAALTFCSLQAKLDQSLQTGFSQKRKSTANCDLTRKEWSIINVELAPTTIHQHKVQPDKAV